MTKDKEFLDRIYNAHLMSLDIIDSMKSLADWDRVSMVHIWGIWSAIIINTRWIEDIYEELGYNTDKVRLDHAHKLSGKVKIDLQNAQAPIYDILTEIEYDGEGMESLIERADEGLGWRDELFKQHIFKVWTNMKEISFTFKNELERWKHLEKIKGDNNEISNGSNPTDSSS